MTYDLTPENTFHLLIVDDDKKLRYLLKKFLTEYHFIITTAANTQEARELLKFFTFDLLILDVMMPHETGLELTKSLRESHFKTPILILTARGETENRITGLELGADDYLGKPFEPKELLLRIKNILKRTSPAYTNPEITFGPFRFNLAKSSLLQEDKEIPLSLGESNILKILVLNLGQCVSREMILKKCQDEINPRTIDVQITRLRRKLEANPKRPRYLQTMRNTGYILWPE